MAWFRAILTHDVGHAELDAPTRAPHHGRPRGPLGLLRARRARSPPRPLQHLPPHRRGPGWGLLRGDGGRRRAHVRGAGVRPAVEPHGRSLRAGPGRAGGHGRERGLRQRHGRADRGAPRRASRGARARGGGPAALRRDRPHPGHRAARHERDLGSGGRRRGSGPPGHGDGHLRDAGQPDPGPGGHLRHRGAGRRRPGAGRLDVRHADPPAALPSRGRADPAQCHEVPRRARRRGRRRGRVRAPSGRPDYGRCAR